MSKYSAIFYEESAQQILMKNEKVFLGHRPHGTIHTTLVFGELLPKRVMGKQVSITVVGYGNDGRNSGFQVVLPEEVRSLFGMKVPHITMSLAEGAKAKDTGNIRFQKITPFTITGIIGSCVDGKITLAR